MTVTKLIASCRLIRTITFPGGAWEQNKLFVDLMPILFPPPLSHCKCERRETDLYLRIITVGGYPLPSPLIYSLSSNQLYKYRFQYGSYYQVIKVNVKDV